MAIGDFNEFNKNFLNRGFNELGSKLDSRIDKTNQSMGEGFNKVKDRFENVQSELRAMLEGSSKLILDRLQQLKAAGGTILDEAGLQGLYNGYKAELEKQLNTLAEALDDYNKIIKGSEQKNAEILDGFRKAAEEYERKKKEALEWEIDLSAREAKAKAGFQGRADYEMSPYRQYHEALDEKEKYLIQLHEDYVSSYKNKEENLTKQLKELSARLQSEYEESQRGLLAERSLLEQRQNALNEREAELNVREEEVRNGLTAEREQLELNYQNQMGQARKLQESNKQLAAKLEETRRELYEREQKVHKAEAIADNGFVEKARELEAELDARRAAVLREITEAEKQDSNMRQEEFTAMLQDLRTYRAEQRRSVEEENKKDLDNFRAKIAEKEAELHNREADLDKRESAVKAKQEEVNTMEAQLKALIEFEGVRQRVLDEEIKRSANGLVNQKIEENKRLEKELVDLRLNYDKQAEINRKFGDKRPDEIYQKIEDLENEIEELKKDKYNLELDIKNLKAGR